jgi:hypothetical protein
VSLLAHDLAEELRADEGSMDDREHAHQPTVATDPAALECAEGV